MTDPNTLSSEQLPAETVVSPDQLSLLPESEVNASAEVTRMDIPHDTTVPAQETVTAVENAVSAAVEPANVDSNPAVENSDQVSSGTKAKIISAFAIVLIAGYVAYWVQEPLQIKADVVSDPAASTQTSPDSASKNLTAAATDTVTDTATETASETLAENSTDTATVAATEASTDTQTSGQSVNVDVSLFGFEPATLKIDKQTTVIWTNTSTEDQTIIGSSPDGQSFASPVLTSGDTFKYKFDQDGTFEYYSTYNPALKATIMVGLGSAVSVDTAPAETTSAAEKNTSNAVTTETANNTLENAIEETGTQETASVSATTESQEETVQEELKPSAETPKKLAKTGPAETVYFGIFLTIAWFNRKKLQKAFSSRR
jgi:plastocyanin